MKRALDIAIALPLLMLLSPVVVVLALAVRVTSVGPAFYRATRVGQGGRTFSMFKLRTMHATEGPAITSADDPRVTRLGRLLRSTRMDELPQLWNVLRGDMSLVGPRPEDPRFVACYSDEQRAVLAVRPGLTGIAQLEFRDEAHLLDPADPTGSYVSRVLPRKLEMDLAYVRQHSFVGDVAILSRTLGTLLTGR